MDAEVVFGKYTTAYPNGDTNCPECHGFGIIRVGKPFAYYTLCSRCPKPEVVGDDFVSMSADESTVNLNIRRKKEADGGNNR